MKKKIILVSLLVILLVGLLFAWKLFGPAVRAGDNAYLFVRSSSTLEDVKKELVDKKILSGTGWFDFMSHRLGYTLVKPGRYKLKEGMSLFNLVRMLKNGQQTPVNFIVIKERTKERLASKIAAAFECDSTEMVHYLNNNDSLRSFGLDSNTAMAAVLPLTYTIRWNTTPGKIFSQFVTAYRNFWNPTRVQQADSLKLSPVQVVTLASIVEEETNKKSDKPLIASTYLNRLRTGMPLQADPTVKFAMQNFALRRVLKVHTQTVSPYNTYLNKGLPPGPICTPLEQTIDAVLQAPATQYLYFVASSNFDGSSVFTTNINDHLKYARAYQKALDQRDSIRKATMPQP